MSEEEITDLMAGEMARDACETVKADCKAGSEAVLRKILIESKSIELLNELSKAAKRAIKEKLKDLVGQAEESPLGANIEQPLQQA